MPFALPDPLLQAMLAEDVPFGDATTLGLEIGAVEGHAVFAARGSILAACTEDAARLMLLAGCDKAEILIPSGRSAQAGTPLLSASGKAEALHRGLKVAQTLLEIASGIATRAGRILAAARAVRPGIAVACTRKHLPGAKPVMLKAIMAAGCIPHRLGLSDSVLVFGQHRVFLAGEPASVWIARLRTSQPERRIAVEADTLEEALVFADAGADAVQLDKLGPEEVAAVVRALGNRVKKPLIAATGGVHEGNAAAYAAAGADLLVTSSPYAAPPADIGVSLVAR